MNNLLTEVSNKLFREGEIKRDERQGNLRQTIILYEGTSYSVYMIYGEVFELKILK